MNMEVHPPNDFLKRLVILFPATAIVGATACWAKPTRRGSRASGPGVPKPRWTARRQCATMGLILSRSLARRS